MATTGDERWRRQAAHVRAALALPERPALDELLVLRDLAGQVLRPMEPPPGVTPRPAAVLLLLYPEAGELHLPLTVRSSRLPSHRGEVSLPGGRTDPEDAGPEATALREAHEELGIDPAAVTVWGRLTSFYIPPSNFQLTPVVGFSPHPPSCAPAPTRSRPSSPSPSPASSTRPASPRRSGSAGAPACGCPSSPLRATRSGAPPPCC